ncbi:hypothetical protein LX70_02391 [Defluviimonas denitrificans]|uniref:Uncharacterized protein n=1 Tax=Albidovulum denitrificans TaxID=404881 RepID=A0A2S8S7L2_9RHOB|nr:hypothetical protein LX70_02391 [Defluviimonas denitrificans]
MTGEGAGRTRPALFHARPAAELSERKISGYLGPAQPGEIE